MEVVCEYPFSFPPATHVWLSEKAIDGLVQFRKRKINDYNHFIKKMKWCAKVGFANAEIAQIVTPQGKGVFRIGVRDNLFRIYGFYDKDRKETYIGIAPYEKRGQDRGREGAAIVGHVAEVKRNGNWIKSSGYPGSDS